MDVIKLIDIEKRVLDCINNPMINNKPLRVAAQIIQAKEQLGKEEFCDIIKKLVKFRFFRLSDGSSELIDNVDTIDCDTILLLKAKFPPYDDN